MLPVKQGHVVVALARPPLYNQLALSRAPLTSHRPAVSIPLLGDVHDHVTLSLGLLSRR